MLVTSQQHNRWLYTWTSPDGKYQNQIDYILCSWGWRSSVQSTKIRPGADCGSDHEIFIAKFRLKLNKVEKATTQLQYSCLENPMDGAAWKAAAHGVAEGQARLNDFTFTFHFHALEKEMATHSSVLAWRIPGTGEPGGLPSMGLHRVGHNSSDSTSSSRESH